MSNFQAPGVYANIKSSGNKPLESVGSSTAAFIGQCAKGPQNEAVLITSWAQYEKAFGNFADSKYLAHAVYGFFANGGSKCFICNVGAEKEGQKDGDLIAAVMGEDKGPAGRTGINAFNNIEEISLVSAPGLTQKEIQNIVIDHCDKLGDRFAILDAEENLTTGIDQMYRAKASPNSAFYFPWVQVYDPVKKQNVYQPPSGFVAGLYARVDSTRGIHKAPANEPLRGVTGLKYNLTREEQTLLNPRGINLIRDFGDAGIKVYGARTLADDAEWKYVNVRRLFLNVRQTVQKGTEWAVFEPNNESLWGSLRRNIAAYLKTLWKSEAIVGSTPEEAFYVICDKTNNPQESIDLGILNVDIGIAPVKPAEFININIQQSLEKNE
jgi:phage tail sheath protein FI